MTTNIADVSSLMRAMSAAAEEIRTLRRANEILQAKVEVMDLFACVLHTRPASHIVGMGEDAAYRLDQEVKKLSAAEFGEADGDPTGGR